MKEIIAIVVLSICVVLTIICTVSVFTKRDPVFDSAIKKLENNQPLTSAEKQRIDDIIIWHKRSLSNGK